MSSSAKPKVYVPRIISDWNYMPPRNVAILSHFSDPVVEPAGTGPIPEDELIRRMDGARALIVRNGQGTEDITARVLKEVGSVEVAVFAHSAYYGPVWDTANKCGIRSARAALYDEQQLVEALRSNRFSAYLDVYAKEPLDPKHPFHALPNVFTTSHIAGTNDVMYERMGLDAINTLREYFQTGVLRDSREAC
jgi:hypothetical protein